MSALWDPIFGAARVAAQVDDAAWVRAMLQAEAALARACASAGIVADDAADAVAAACADAGWVPIGELGERAAAGGNPVIPLVRLLRERVGPDAAKAVHAGATSQDILDTAAMLVTRRALDVITEDLTGAADAAARLARTHRDTPMVARTLLQQALPTTFGAVAAGWGAGLDRAADALEITLDVQLGGAAGTLAALYPHGPAVRAAFASELGLADPGSPWHTERTRIGELAGALASAAGAIGKVATDIVLLAQTEVGEVAESDSGGSSAMPHKRNPVAAITARAAAAQAPGLAATLFAAMAGEHQRPAGAWHAEWPALVSLLRGTGGAAARLRQSLVGLHIDPEAMKLNLDRTSGLILTERVATAIGHPAARDAVERAARKGGDLAEALLAEPSLRLDKGRLAELLDPSTYLGHTGDLVDEYLRGRE